MLKGNGHGVAFARGNVLLPHSHPLLKLQKVSLNRVMVSRGLNYCGVKHMDFPRLLRTWSQLLSWEDRRKIEPKEIASCLIPRLLVVFNWQLEIVVTALHTVIYK